MSECIVLVSVPSLFSLLEFLYCRICKKKFTVRMREFLKVKLTKALQ